MIVLTEPKTRMRGLRRAQGQVARGLVRASNHRLTMPSISIAEPLTLACWAYPLVAASVNQCLMSIRVDYLTSGSFVGLILDNSNPSLLSAAAWVAAYSASSKSGVVANRWQHMAGVYSAANNKRAYLDGVAATANTTNRGTDASLDAYIGYFARGVSTGPFGGQLHWPCIWSAALTAGEIQSLARGTPPWEIRPQSIVACPDMQSLYDPYLRATWTNSGTTIAEPPRLYRPRKTLFIPQAAPSTGKLLLMRRRRMYA